MANYMFNIAKGRVVEYYNRVKSNDPANSALILVPCSATGTQATVLDTDDLTAAIAAGMTAAGGSWGRKTLTDTELVALPAPVDASDLYAVALPAVTWTSPTTGQNTVALLVCYDSDTTGGTDANIIPLSHHDFSVTADGNNVVLTAGNFFSAS